MAKKKPEFEKGWRVLVHLPESGVQEGIVGDTVQRKKISKRAWWVWVNVKGSWMLVREENIKYKPDELYGTKFGKELQRLPEAAAEYKAAEPHCSDFVEELQQASLVRRMVKGVERERIVTPTDDKGYLRATNGHSWWRGSEPVRNKVKARVLDETYQRLVAQAKAAAASARA